MAEKEEKQFDYDAELERLTKMGRFERIPIAMAKISENGQITIPAEIRKRLEIRKGDKIIFYERDELIHITNSSADHRAISKAQIVFSKLRKEFGVETVEDVDNMIAEMRKKKN